MNMIQRLRLFSLERGFPCIAIQNPARPGDVHSLVNEQRRIYTAQPSPHLLLTAPTLTPGQAYSEHPADVLLVDGAQVHIEALFDLLNPAHPVQPEDLLRLAGLDEVEPDQGRIGAAWYPLERREAAGGAAVVLVTPHTDYTLITQVHTQAAPPLWTLDTALTEAQAAGLFKEHACSAAPRNPHPTTLPRLTPFMGG